MEFKREDVDQVVQDIWSGMLGLSVVGHEGEIEMSGERGISALVQVTGEWEGAVAVNCSEGLGRVAATTMFGIESGEVTEADIHDAMGEIANMTAGNIKGYIEGYCRLSLPTVTGGARMSISMPGSRVVSSVAYDCSGHSFSVVLVERT